MLQFIFGNSGSGKSRFLYQKIIEESRLHPELRYLVIVPEQFTMQTQRDLVLLHPDGGIMNIDVLSFRRLAHRVFEEVGTDRRVVLTETGKNLMLRRVAEQRKEELKVLGARMNRTGYISEVKSILSELMQYEIADSDLQTMLEAVKGRPLLHAKLEDIRVLYQAFLDFQKDRFMKPEELMEVLARVAKDSQLLKKSVLAFDGFAGFTPSQLHVLGELLAVCPMVYLTVTIDARENFFGEIEEHELFAPSQRMIKSVVKTLSGEGSGTDRVRAAENAVHSAGAAMYLNTAMNSPVVLGPSGRSGVETPPRCASRDIPPEGRGGHPARAGRAANERNAAHLGGAVEMPPRCASDDLPRFLKDGALRHLEQNLFRKKQSPYSGESDEISLHVSTTPAQEVHFAARTITRLVRERHYRYRDIAVIAGDLSAYGNYVKKIFPMYGIPSFVDETRRFLLNPCLEFVRGALAMVQQDFSRETVFRFLRTGMAGLSGEETDRLENYVIAAGIRGRKSWEQEWIWYPRRGVGTEASPRESMGGLELCNALRVRFMERVGAFAEEMQVKGRTLLEYTRTLYRLLEDCGVQQHLKDRETELSLSAAGMEMSPRNASHLSGAMELASEYSQVYPVLIGLLEEMADLLGEERMDCREFAEILDAGLSEAKIGIIPPGIDQVQVGDIRRSRLSNVKVLFFLGLNDGWVPARGDGGGIVSDTEREILLNTGAKLAPSARENSYIQRFYLYQNLTKPQDLLYLSWCQSSGDGTAMRPSYLVSVIGKLFPNLKVHKEEDAGTLLEQVTSRENGMLYFLHGLQEKEKIRPSWLELYRQYLCDGDYRSRVRDLAGASFLRGQLPDTEWLEVQTAKELYRAVAPDRLQPWMSASVTRLEQYAACAFSHFASYGLRLRERAEYGVRAADIGTLFHEAIELFSERMLADGCDWGECSYEEQAAKMDDCVDRVAESYAGGILHGSAREEYTILRLRRILRRTVWVMREQTRAGRFRPVGFEISFADTGDLNAVHVHLGENGKIRLQGRIDRIDTAETQDTVYVKVVDYKSGTEQFDPVSLYYGLQLQLVVYLNAAIEMEQKLHPDKKIIPAGIFYHRLQDPVLEKEESSRRAGESLLKKMRPNGLVNSDGPVIRLMDEAMSGDSLVIPVGLKKDGTVKAASSTATTDQFEALSGYVTQMLERMGEAILNGSIEARPFTDKSGSACDYCLYADVCGYDRRIPGRCAKREPELTASEVWERLSNAKRSQNDRRDLSSPDGILAFQAGYSPSEGEVALPERLSENKQEGGAEAWQ